MPVVIEEPPHYAAARCAADAAPQPAAVDNIACGTAGWTDPTLLKSRRFYPKGTAKSESRLRYYAQHFRLVEVDATYYTLLDPARAAHWVEWTPTSFVFNVKAHASLTGHPVDTKRLPAALREEVERRVPADRPRLYPKDLPKDLLEAMWGRFEASLGPLRDAGKLGSVLMQFPPWVTATRGHARHLEELAERWAALPIAVEFRHPSWLQADRRERVFSLLEKLKWSFVGVDEPAVVGGGVPFVARVTNPALAVFRFHGHNSKGWRRGSSVVERFNYLYQLEELQPWLEPVRRVAREAEQVHVIFNNCVRDFAIVNAKDLALLLVNGAATAPSTP